MPDRWWAFRFGDHDRVGAALAPEGQVSRRVQALLATGVLVFSGAATATSVASETDSQQEGVTTQPAAPTDDVGAGSESDTPLPVDVQPVLGDPDQEGTPGGPWSGPTGDIPLEVGAPEAVTPGGGAPEGLTSDGSGTGGNGPPAGAPGGPTSNGDTRNRSTPGGGQGDGGTPGGGQGDGGTRDGGEGDGGAPDGDALGVGAPGSGGRPGATPDGRPGAGAPSVDGSAAPSATPSSPRSGARGLLLEDPGARHRTPTLRMTKPHSGAKVGYGAAAVSAGDVTARAPASEPASVPVAQAVPAAAPLRLQGRRFHVVQPGESLWAIAAALVDPEASAAVIARQVRRLWRLNRTRIGTGDPSVLPVGVRLRLR